MKLPAEKRKKGETRQSESGRGSLASPVRAEFAVAAAKQGHRRLLRCVADANSRLRPREDEGGERGGRRDRRRAEKRRQIKLLLRRKRSRRPASPAKKQTAKRVRGVTPQTEEWIGEGFAGEGGQTGGRDESEARGCALARGQTRRQSPAGKAARTMHEGNAGWKQERNGGAKKQRGIRAGEREIRNVKGRCDDAERLSGAATEKELRNADAQRPRQAGGTRSFLVSLISLDFSSSKMAENNANAAQKFQRSIEELTAQNPHTDDPRCMQINQMNNCSMRYAMFARCCKELGDDNTRCKYQFYRAQVACPIEQIEIWEDHRQKGSCHFDLLPEFSTRHMWQ
ncbi:hypothetical protein BESB_018350 [Besnoitia besnoiti]|uniref:Uncharacterized protein n=1 Tax=Besnoitia besnoiti TaxID=94643 RepID=A0A2A9MA75_BESBE|nr:hypothetical protein BESB_018350 [Besnoitia besnoiti]PFH32517.1 hypothetical protein BESB_018350 [Besnoitia besnoiti]